MKPVGEISPWPIRPFFALAGPQGRMNSWAFQVGMSSRNPDEGNAIRKRGHRPGMINLVSSFGRIVDPDSSTRADHGGGGELSDRLPTD